MADFEAGTAIPPTKQGLLHDSRPRIVILLHENRRDCLALLPREQITRLRVEMEGPSMLVRVHKKSGLRYNPFHYLNGIFTPKVWKIQAPIVTSL